MDNITERKILREMNNLEATFSATTLQSNTTKISVNQNDATESEVAENFESDSNYLDQTASQQPKNFNSSLSFLSNQFGKFNINSDCEKDIEGLSDNIQVNSSDDEAFLECESFVSNQGEKNNKITNRDSITPTNFVGATHESLEHNVNLNNESMLSLNTHIEDPSDTVTFEKLNDSTCTIDSVNIDAEHGLVLECPNIENECTTQIYCDKPETDLLPDGDHEIESKDVILTQFELAITTTTDPELSCLKHEQTEYGFDKSDTIVENRMNDNVGPMNNIQFVNVTQSTPIISSVHSNIYNSNKHEEKNDANIEESTLHLTGPERHDISVMDIDTSFLKESNSILMQNYDVAECSNHEMDKYNNEVCTMDVDTSPGKDPQFSLSNVLKSDPSFKKPEVPKNHKIQNTDTDEQTRESFRSSDGFQFSDSDFEILESVQPGAHDLLERKSLLLQFDPLLKKPILSLPTTKNLEITVEDPSESTESPKGQTITESSYDVGDVGKIKDLNVKGNESDACKNMSCVLNHDMEEELDQKTKSDIIMSEREVDLKMSELEKKARNDVLKSEELEKKLDEELRKRLEMEQREEQLLKRISDKDRAFTKLQNVVAEYEKAISEMITEKEVLVHQYESKCKELKEDSDTNALHLSSLEATFSDLHVKYERTKQVASELKEREAALLAEKKALEENLRIQEQRYEKMKNHAVSQLETANQQLEEQMKSHQFEITKLRAQLKKEEVSRASIQEQLSQKSKENEELVKICDELINGGGSS